jgi:N-methylhydantoinase A
MGGTSFDVTVIRGGQPELSSEKDIRYAVPVRVPMIDIHTIGAGGGSIARVNRGGLLEVGPESAGSQPGPICYGRGGARVTVTDAHVLLGRIDPSAIAGAAATELADVRAAMVEQVGRPLGLDADRAAAAVLAVVGDQLAGAIRLKLVEKGHDPRDFVLVAFGGAGPLHAVGLARELGIPRVLVPRFPGITSALGCALADVRHDFVQTVNRPLRETAGPAVDALLDEQARRGRALVEREAVEIDRVEVVHEADLLHEGQTHVLRIPIDGAGFEPAAVGRRFAERYQARFDIELPGVGVTLINLRTAVIGRRRPLDLGRLAAGDGAAGGEAVPGPVGPGSPTPGRSMLRPYADRRVDRVDHAPRGGI